LLARYEIWHCTKESLSHAIQLLNNSLDKIGRNEYLLIALGTAYFQYVNAGVDPDAKYLTIADDLVDEALTLNPDLSKAYYLKSAIQETRGDLRAAFISSKKSIKLDPNDSESLMMLAFMYTLVGKPDEAKPYAKHAIECDPLYALAYVGEWWINLAEGRFDRAAETSYIMHNLDKNNLLWVWAYAHALVCNNKVEEANEVLDSLIGNNRDQSWWSLLGKVLKHAINNEIQDALESVSEQLKKAAEMDHVASWFLAEVYAIIGEKEKAIDYMERVTKEIFINYPLFSEYDPLLENIRSEERFKKLMVQVKLKWENFDV
jgi:non-specific serine/threonine protein kinase